MRRINEELVALDDLPQKVCSQCGKSKILGLFTPLELKNLNSKCRKCIGELNERHKPLTGKGLHSGPGTYGSNFTVRKEGK